MALCVFCVDGQLFSLPREVSSFCDQLRSEYKLIVVCLTSDCTITHAVDDSTMHVKLPVVRPHGFWRWINLLSTSGDNMRWELVCLDVRQWVHAMRYLGVKTILETRLLDHCKQFSDGWLTSYSWTIVTGTISKTTEFALDVAKAFRYDKDIFRFCELYHICDKLWINSYLIRDFATQNTIPASLVQIIRDLNFGGDADTKEVEEAEDTSEYQIKITKPRHFYDQWSLLACVFAGGSCIPLENENKKTLTLLPESDVDIFVKLTKANIVLPKLLQECGKQGYVMVYLSEYMNDLSDMEQKSTWYEGLRFRCYSPTHRTLDIIIVLDIQNKLEEFDMSQCCAFFDGKCTYHTLGAEQRWKQFTLQSNQGTKERVEKYLRRGFTKSSETSTYAEPVFKKPKPNFLADCWQQDLSYEVNMQLIALRGRILSTEEITPDLIQTFLNNDVAKRKMWSDIKETELTRKRKKV